MTEADLEIFRARYRTSVFVDDCDARGKSSFRPRPIKRHQTDQRAEVLKLFPGSRGE